MGIFKKSIKNRQDKALYGISDDKLNNIFIPRGVKLDAVLTGFEKWSGGRNNPVVAACVNRIVSRALEIPIKLPPKIADRPYIRVYDWRQFWRMVYECVLYDGFAYLHKESDDRLALASFGAVINDESAGIVRFSITRQTQALQDDVVVKRHDEVAPVMWDSAGTIPSELVKDEINAYCESVDDMLQQAKYERRFASELEVSANFTARPSEIEEQLRDIKSALRGGRKYQTPFIGHGVQFQPRTFSQSPPHRERQELAVAHIARIYGVPVQFLQVGDGQRMSIEELDAHLIRDAVLPLVKNTAAAVARLYMNDVDVDEWRIALPTKTGMSGLMMQLAQTGAITINEIREIAGLPKMPDGDKLPETAGAAERKDDGQKPNSNDNQKNPIQKK